MFSFYLLLHIFAECWAQSSFCSECRGMLSVLVLLCSGTQGVLTRFYLFKAEEVKRGEEERKQRPSDNSTGER